MTDPIPEGFISLVDAYKLYDEAFPGADKHEELIRPFEERQLEALVQYPGQVQRHRLWPWERSYIPERVFWRDSISNVADTPWQAFDGRTPFVDERSFRDWLAAQRAFVAKEFDPHQEPHWTIGMTAAWIADRTDDAVRDEWPRYYRDYRCCDGPGSIALSEGLMGAANEVLRAVTSGKLAMVGVRQADQLVVQIPAIEMPYLELAFDGPPEYAERLDRRDGGLLTTKYRHLLIAGADIRAFWPSPTVQPVRNPVANLRNRKVEKYDFSPGSEVDEWTAEFFAKAEAHGTKTRRAHEFHRALTERFAGIGTEARNKLHRRHNPKPRYRDA
jgi:hypothetical protein